MAAFSIAAALGGMVAPAALYIALQNGREGMHGWGSVMATDTALVIGCLALLGRRIPQRLRIFMLSLAIVDDIGAETRCNIVDIQYHRAGWKVPVGRVDVEVLLETRHQGQGAEIDAALAALGLEIVATRG